MKNIYGGRHARQGTCHPRPKMGLAYARGEIWVNQGFPTKQASLDNTYRRSHAHCPNPRPHSGIAGFQRAWRSALGSNRTTTRQTLTHAEDAPTAPYPLPAAVSQKVIFRARPNFKSPYYPRSSGRTTNSTLPSSFSTPTSILKR